VRHSDRSSVARLICLTPAFGDGPFLARLRRTGGLLGMSAKWGILEAVGRRPKRRDWTRRGHWASSPMSPADFCIGPAQPDRENPAEREEQVAREGRTALLECGVLVQGHRRNFAIIHRPGTSRPGAAVEKR
jgi:hypothetical protein